MTEEALPQRMARYYRLCEKGPACTDGMRCLPSGSTHYHYEDGGAVPVPVSTATGVRRPLVHLLSGIGKPSFAVCGSARESVVNLTNKFSEVTCHDCLLEIARRAENSVPVDTEESEPKKDMTDLIVFGALANVRDMLVQETVQLRAAAARAKTDRDATDYSAAALGFDKAANFVRDEIGRVGEEA